MTFNVEIRRFGVRRAFFTFRGVPFEVQPRSGRVEVYTDPDCSGLMVFLGYYNEVGHDFERSTRFAVEDSIRALDLAVGMWESDRIDGMREISRSPGRVLWTGSAVAS